MQVTTSPSIPSSINLHILVVLLHRPVPQILQLVNLTIVVILGIEQVFVERVVDLARNTQLVRRDEFTDQQNRVIEGQDLPGLTSMRQLPPRRIGVCLGVDEVEDVLDHLPLMDGRVETLKPGLLSLRPVDSKIRIEPHFNPIPGSNANHSVPDTQNPIKPEQILKPQQTRPQYHHSVDQLLRRQVT